MKAKYGKIMQKTEWFQIWYAYVFCSKHQGKISRTWKSISCRWTRDMVQISKAQLYLLWVTTFQIQNSHVMDRHIKYWCLVFSYVYVQKHAYKNHLIQMVHSSRIYFQIGCIWGIKSMPKNGTKNVSKSASLVSRTKR